MSFSWFYLEQLKVSRFLLNSHLFPKKLQDTVHFLSQDCQKTKLFFEEESLGAAGTLYQLKKELKKTESFIYINGDSLFFPSQRSHIKSFEEVFFNLGLSALFFVTPYKGTAYKRVLWCDRDLNLKFVGSKEDLAHYRLSHLTPFIWTGLALFKSFLLDSLKERAFDLFQDFVNSFLKTHKVKVYVDPSAVLLEAGNKPSYLEATQFCLDCLFHAEGGSKNSDFDKGGERLKVHFQEGKKKSKERLKKEAEEVHNRNQMKQALTASHDRHKVKKMLEDCFHRF